MSINASSPFPIQYAMITVACLHDFVLDSRCLRHTQFRPTFRLTSARTLPVAEVQSVVPAHCIDLCIFARVSEGVRQRCYEVNQWKYSGGVTA
jgi:hypothetical protein